MAKSRKRLRNNHRNVQQRIIVISYSYDETFEFWLAPIGFRGKEIITVVEGQTLPELHESVLEELETNPLLQGCTVSYGIDSLKTPELKKTEIALFFANKNL